MNNIILSLNENFFSLQETRNCSLFSNKKKKFIPYYCLTKSPMNRIMFPIVSSELGQYANTSYLQKEQASHSSRNGTICVPLLKKKRVLFIPKMERFLFLISWNTLQIGLLEKLYLWRQLESDFVSDWIFKQNNPKMPYLDNWVDFLT